MGQLLVVAHHTAYEPSLCYEPELIPDPIADSESLMVHRVETSRTAIGRRLLDLGSVA